MLNVKGALTERSMGIPTSNIGLVMRMTRAEFTEEQYEKYPENFTRIHLKVSTYAYKYVDCLETPEEILEQSQKLEN